MIAIDAPRPAHKKASLFNRFSRKLSGEQLPSKHIGAYNGAVAPPTRLRKRSLDRHISAPGPRPTRSRTEAHVENKRMPSPHLSKDKAYRKDKLATPFRCLDVSRITYERSSRSSSSSSTSRSNSSARVQASVIPTSPFPSYPQNRTKVTTWNIYLPPAQVRALYLGFLPADMEDKWFIYSEGPDVMGKLKVHFHRSWTGNKVAELFVVMDVKGEGAGKIVGIKWDGGVDVGNGKMDSQEAKYIVRTTVLNVLDVDLEEGY